MQKTIKNLILKFTSGNNVPVKDARITRKEFEVIHAFLYDRGYIEEKIDGLL